MMSDDVVSRYLTLISQLKQRTTMGSLSWENLGRGDDLGTSVANFSFSIGTQDNDGVDPFVLSIYDSRGNLQLSVTSSDEEYPEAIHQAIRDLWTSTNNNEAHVIATLEAALRAIDDEPPF